jgi:hypothetical protein
MSEVLPRLFIHDYLPLFLAGEIDQWNRIALGWSDCGLSPLAIVPAMTQANMVTIINVSSDAFFISCFLSTRIPCQPIITSSP